MGVLRMGFPLRRARQPSKPQISQASTRFGLPGPIIASIIRERTTERIRAHVIFRLHYGGGTSSTVCIRHRRIRPASHLFQTWLLEQMYVDMHGKKVWGTMKISPRREEAFQWVGAQDH